MPSRGRVAFLAGFGLAAVSALPFPFTAILALPGWLIASTIWFRVFHFGTVSNVNHPMAFFAVVYAGTFLVWAALTYAFLTFRARRDHAV
ncbi:MAG: hypothetical protein WEF99_09440 [Thermoanaerobaculia bacterium]